MPAAGRHVIGLALCMQLAIGHASIAMLIQMKSVKRRDVARSAMRGNLNSQINTSSQRHAETLANARKIRPLGFVRGAQNSRQKKIVEMMKHAWNKGYVEHCWGTDEFYPVSETCGTGWKMGLTLVDSLDTLYLMGLSSEFEAARNWIADKDALNFDRVGNVNLFETTIRVLGGLLGAHALTGDSVFAERAHELGERLLPALDGNGKGVPFSDIELSSGFGQWLGGDESVAEATSLRLEFETLSKLSGSSAYDLAVKKVAKTFHDMPKMDGLTQTLLGRSGEMAGAYSFGSRGDSYYEYLLKEWLLTCGKDVDALADYRAAMKGMQEHLLKNTTGPLHLAYIAEDMGGDRINPKMDHLVCYLPGLLALGAHHNVNKQHLGLAKQLMRTCVHMYKASGHMLGPEIAYFDTEGSELLIKPYDAHDILRPETVESLFYLYRITHDRVYQDWGWEIAKAIERYAKVQSGGYTSLDSVLTDPPLLRDKMESFFTAETLKYLFLLFDDSRTQVPLEQFVFNTEAHPLRVFPSQPGAESC